MHQIFYYNFFLTVLNDDSQFLLLLLHKILSNLIIMIIIMNKIFNAKNRIILLLSQLSNDGEFLQFNLFVINKKHSKLKIFVPLSFILLKTLSVISF